MAAINTPRREAINGIFSLYFTAKEKPTQKNLLAMVNAIKAFINKTPRAFADLSNALGQAQDLLLVAAARAQKKYIRQRFYQWENELGNARLSRSGQTHPQWLNTNGAGLSVLLSTKAPSLDGDDKGDASEDDVAPEKLYYAKNCDLCMEHTEPETEDPAQFPVNLDIENDFQD